MLEFHLLFAELGDLLAYLSKVQDYYGQIMNKKKGLSRIENSANRLDALKEVCH